VEFLLVLPFLRSIDFSKVIGIDNSSSNLNKAQQNI
jgi:hypothetical protein